MQNLRFRIIEQNREKNRCGLKDVREITIIGPN